MSGKIKPWTTGHWNCQLVYPQNPWLLVRRQLTTCYSDAYGRCLHPSKKWNEGQYHVSLYECFAETYGESFSVLCMILRNKRMSQCDGFWRFVRKDSGIDNIEALSISIQSLSGLFRRWWGKPILSENPKVSMVGSRTFDTCSDLFRSCCSTAATYICM